MIARTWTATIEEDRADEYEAFARDISLPMFTSAKGCLGVVMTRHGPDCQVLTLWHDAADITALELSSIYQGTVERILEAGFIRAANERSVAPAHLAWCRTG